MDSSATNSLIQQYEQILSRRQERFSSDAVFGGAKYQFEKALLEEIAHVREPARAESLQLMFRELASFVPQSDYDLIAIVKVKVFDDIAKFVTEQLVKVPGIVRTNTISAFRVYSRRDREAGFTLGEH